MSRFIKVNAPDDITQVIKLVDRTYTRQVINVEKIVGIMPIRYHATTDAEWNGVRIMFEDSSEFLVAGTINDWADLLHAESSPDHMQLSGGRVPRNVRIRDASLAGSDGD
jgi:hypothetical protein